MNIQSTEHTIRINDSEVHYWEYGDAHKPTIVVVHGYRGTHHGLEYVIAHLLPDFHIITPDLPGFGKSSDFPSLPHTIQSYSSTVHQLITQLSLDGCILLGHSMGTVVVADILKHAPTIATAAIMINPVSETPPKLRLLPGHIYHSIAGKYLPENLGNAVLKNKTLLLAGSIVMTKTKDPELRKLIHWNHTTYMQNFASRKSLLESLASANSTSLSDYIPYLQVPLLMIVGKSDAIAPVQGQRRIAKRLPTAQLVEIERVGHIIHYEHPKQAADAIKAFLASRA